MTNSNEDKRDKHPDPELRDLLWQMLRAEGMLFPITDEEIEEFEKNNEPDTSSREHIVEDVLKRIREGEQPGERESGEEEETSYPWQKFESRNASESTADEELKALYRKGEELSPEEKRQIDEDIQRQLEKEAEEEEPEVEDDH